MQEYSLHFTFREEWIDRRLYFNSDKLKYVNLAPNQLIWMPDTFFQNEKEARRHLIDKPNVLIRIYPDGGILYSVRCVAVFYCSLRSKSTSMRTKNCRIFRLTLTLSCPMFLHYYPLDRQKCLIDLASCKSRMGADDRGTQTFGFV